MHSRLAACIAIGSILLTSQLVGADKKKKKKGKKEEPEITQVLEIPKDPPAAIVAQTERLTFHVSPLSAKGLLSQQIRDGLKALWNVNRGAQIVKVRAFVAGSGDMRRVPAIVSEMFTDKHLPLPAVSVVQVGGLPLDGAQVVLESMAMDKKVLNPHGIAFVAGQPATVADAVGPLKAALGSMEPRAITCFLNTLEGLKDVRPQIAAAYPQAVTTYVQLRRDTVGDFVECEAVAAADKPPANGIEYRNAREGRYSDVAVVGPDKVVLSGTQLAFGGGESDVRLAFGRLEKAMTPVGGKLSDTVLTRFYPLTSAAAEATRKVRFEFYNAKQPPASTLLIFEGLPSLDALVGVEVVALHR